MTSSLQRNGVHDTRVCVALSGGIDSVVLLHALCGVAPRFQVRLSALHVNHGISPNARAWETFCRTLCRRLQVPLAVRRVKVARRGRGIEAAAREARYAALSASRAQFVALAHQLDDQAETVLFNLLRGTGLAGASGMAACAPLHGDAGGEIRALRPLLAVAREDIAAYARECALDWVEDESNADEMLTRNWVRRRVAPLLAARFPRWREALARGAAHFAEAQALLLPSAPKALTVAMLKAVPAARGRLLLRGFLRAAGLRAPTAAALGEMLRQLVSSPPDAHLALPHDGRILRCYRGEVRLSVRLSEEAAVAPSRDVQWRGEARLVLPDGRGELRLRKCRGGGIAAEKLLAQSVTVRARRGGEKLRLASGRPSRTLKNLFQEAGIAPWERDLRPLLFCGDDLVWVPGLGISSAYLAPQGADGFAPEWHPPLPADARRTR